MDHTADQNSYRYAGASAVTSTLVVVAPSSSFNDRVTVSPTLTFRFFCSSGVELTPRHSVLHHDQHFALGGCGMERKLDARDSGLELNVAADGQFLPDLQAGRGCEGRDGGEGVRAAPRNDGRDIGHPNLDAVAGGPVRDNGTLRPGGDGLQLPFPGDGSFQDAGGFEGTVAGFGAFLEGVMEFGPVGFPGGLRPYNRGEAKNRSESQAGSFCRRISNCEFEVNAALQGSIGW